MKGNKGIKKLMEVCNLGDKYWFEERKEERKRDFIKDFEPHISTHHKLWIQLHVQELESKRCKLCFPVPGG